MDANRKTADRRIIYCLRCHKPQEMLPTHLARVCMKGSTSPERQAESQRAKESMKEWTREARNWDYREMRVRYPHRPTRRALLQDLLKKNFLVDNIPSDDDDDHSDEPSTSRAATEQILPAVSGGAEEASRTKEGSSTNSSEEDGSPDPTWQGPPAKYTTSVRINMQSLGLYEKFPAEAAVLADFKHFLIHMQDVPHCQQEVDNVSRMLRFIQPNGDEVSMDFLVKSTETQDFLSRLKSTKMGPSTIINYIKNMIRFVEYLKTKLDFASADADFHRKCQLYIDLLKSLRKPLSKANSKVTCKTRYDRFLHGQRSVRDCQTLLRVAKADMLGVWGKLIQKEYVVSEEKTLFRYYCEAILILKHFQRPGAVEGLTATEWLERKTLDNRVLVGISKHKTAAMQIASFGLTTEEEAMLDGYYTWIRPDYISQDAADNGRFFINAHGRPIRSATNDLSRLHAHFKVPNVTSQEIRRVVETAAGENFTTEQKGNVAHYMAHSTAVAEAHYRMTSLAKVVATSTLLHSLGGSSDESAEESTARAPKRGRDADEEGEGEGEGTKSFPAFLMSFPVTKTGNPPTKKQRVDAGFQANRIFYDKWRALQYGQREEYLLSKCSRRPPTINKVEKYIQDEGWTANHPRPEEIVSKWKPANKTQVESDPVIIKMITKQKWSGLATKDFGGEKGRGVVATTNFAVGSIVCDYHGKVISKAEGNQMMESLEDRMGYLFFFKDLCIDAQTFPCECHPGMETIGRLINHSRKRFNLKPLHCKVNFPEGERDIILFQATKDIEVNEELVFDYGVKRKSFRGEGISLDWLDS